MEEIFRTDASPILGAKCKRELMGPKISLTICGMFAYPNSFHILFLAQYSPFLPNRALGDRKELSTIY